MEKEHKERLKVNRGALIDNLYVSQVFLSELMACNIITDYDMEKIQSIPTRYDKAGHILDVVKTRGPEAFEKFQQVLRNTGQGPLADMLDRPSDGDVITHQKKCLDEKIKVLGPQHLDTATSYSSLGRILQGMGKYKEALDYHKKCLEVREEILGPKHPETATTYSNIGSILRAMGEYKEALDYHKKSLEVKKEILGPKHPETATSYSNIGSILQAMGKYKEALDYHKKCLEVSEEFFGQKHPKTATSYSNIGSILQAMGKYEDALTYHNKCLEVREGIIIPKQALSMPPEKQAGDNQEKTITVAASLSHLTLEDENTIQAEGQTLMHASQEKGWSQFPEEINRQDQLLQEAYQRACKDGFERVKRARVMLLGHSGAGKTHLRKRLLGKEYNEDKDRITNGIETDYVLVKEGWNADEAECHGPAISCLLAENTRKIHEEIWGSHAASSKPSEKQSDVNQEEMITVAPSLSHLTLEDENILQAEGQTVVHASQDKGLETQPSPKSSNLKTEENTELPPDVLTHLTESAYDIENPPARLTVWDFGGQSVYYNTHHTFLSSRAIYILAIDMSLDLTDRLEDQWHSAEQFSGTVLDFTVYWIDAIHTYAPQQDNSEDGVSSPRIIIVCTHKDKYLENVPKERHEEKINAYFSTLRQHIQQKRSGVHVDPCFFAIDNTCQDEDHEITDLRRYVMKIAESQKSWGEKNPIRWSRLEDELELRQPPEKRKKKLIQYEELKKLALKVEMQDENELNSFLLFHHDIGDLLHPQRFGDLLHSQTVDLSDIVILNPWWLIDTFKSIITVDKHHVKTKGSLYWFALKRGILDERLLDELWGDDSELKPILISAMVKFNILLEQNLSKTEEPTCRQFYVPTLLPIYKNPASVVGSEDTLFIQGKDNFMPHVLFNRLTVKLVQNSTSTGRKVLRRRRDFFLFKNELYYDYAVFAIDPLRGACCALRKAIDSSCIELIPLYPPGAKFDATIQGAYDKFKGHVVTVLQELMKSICPHLQLEWCVRDPRNPKKLMAIDPKETDLTACELPEDSVYRLWFMPSSSEKVHGASPSAVRSPSDAGDAIETACKGFPRKPGIVTVFPAYKANEHYPPFIAVLVSIEFCGNKVSEYEGFTVNYYSWDMPDMEAQIALFSQEAEENPIPPEKSAEFGQVIQRVSQGLFANHRNLTIISASPVKVTGGKISRMPCIVLYCPTKGVVPLGESLFPVSIEGFPVDVREGYVLLSMNNGQPQNPAVRFGQSAAFYSNPLRMGCSIGRRGLNLTGTLGMFVEHEGSTCFLTCSHVLGIPQPAIGTEVCQPSDADQEANYHNQLVGETVDSSSRARVCGVVKNWVFRNVDIKGEQYGIDAALIKVQGRGTYGIPAGLVPQRLRDLKITENELTFTSEAYIKCSDDLKSHTLFKCGRQTGLTKGIATFVGGAAYQPCTVEYCNNVGWTFQDTLSSMVEVCAPRNSSSAMFADCGDSGAAVFYLKNGKPYIVGMVVARTSYFSALVSPIWPILEYFNIESPREEEDMETE